MIAFLKGILIVKESDRIILEANGVGYEVFTPNINRLPELGSEIKVYTHYHKTDDNEFLYGFLTQEEKAFFRTLMSVPDIGPKVAVAIIASLGIDKVRSAIVSGDSPTLQTVPRVGRKLAERIIVDLREKLKSNANIPVYKTALDGETESDLVSALIRLGYNATLARNVIDKLRVKYIERKPGIDELLKEALKELSPK